ncbi:MAG: hypothetical protein V1645_00460 [archaeon]
MKRIILDTNFIIETAKNNIDLGKELSRIIDESYKLCTAEGTKEELEKIAKENKIRDREAAKFGLKMIEKMGILKADGKNVDEKIKNLSDNNTIIATQDKELKKKIKGHIIVVRQKKHLQLI